MVEMASLNFVQRNDDGFEENNVLLSQRHSKPRDDAGQNIEEFRRPIEFEVLVDEGVETVCDGLSDHLSPRNQLGVKPMEDVFEVFSLSGLF